MKRYKNRIDIEYDVMMIEQSVRNENDLESNWYGDYYGDEINGMYAKMEYAENEEQYEEYLEEVKRIFEGMTGNDEDDI